MISNSLTENKKIYSIEEIKEAMIKACIKSSAIYFKYFLLSDNVTTEFPTKENFYEFFKYILSCSRKMSKGELHLKIVNKMSDNKNVQEYQFYDAVHLHPRLIIFVEETDDFIHLDISPF